MEARLHGERRVLFQRQEQPLAMEASTRFDRVELDVAAPVLAAELAIGEFIIGADDNSYMIEEIGRDLEYEYELYCVNDQGLAVKANVARNAYINKVINPPELAEGVYGLRLCQSCDKLRSRSRQWAEDDYICLLCRRSIDGT